MLAFWCCGFLDWISEFMLIYCFCLRGFVFAAWCPIGVAGFACGHTLLAVLTDRQRGFVVFCFKLSVLLRVGLRSCGFVGVKCIAHFAILLIRYGVDCSFKILLDIVAGDLDFHFKCCFYYLARLYELMYFALFGWVITSLGFALLDGLVACVRCFRVVLGCLPGLVICGVEVCTGGAFGVVLVGLFVGVMCVNFQGLQILDFGMLYSVLHFLRVCTGGTLLWTFGHFVLCIMDLILVHVILRSIICGYRVSGGYLDVGFGCLYSRLRAWGGLAFATESGFVNYVWDFGLVWFALYIFRVGCLVAAYVDCVSWIVILGCRALSSGFAVRVLCYLSVEGTPKVLQFWKLLWFVVLVLGRRILRVLGDAYELTYFVSDALCILFMWVFDEDVILDLFWGGLNDVLLCNSLIPGAKVTFYVGGLECYWFVRSNMMVCALLDVCIVVGLGGDLIYADGYHMLLVGVCCELTRATNGWFCMWVWVYDCVHLVGRLCNLVVIVKFAVVVFMFRDVIRVVLPTYVVVFMVLLLYHSVYGFDGVCVAGPLEVLTC
eukprot:gene3267-2249_t